MSYEIIVGDCLEQLRGMEAASVQCCITSPPYFGLRDYGNDAQIGLEQTPDEYVAKLVEVFAEVKRVLRDDGTLWLNLGDSYAGSWGAQSRGATSQLADRSISAQQIIAHPKRNRTGAIPAAAAYKNKDLLGIPWMVAFALRADGWYLRSEIIWAKPNPMPESVTDRPTKAHEQVFLLSKSRSYFYDADAIKDRYAEGTAERYEAGGFSDRYADAADAKGYRGPFGGKDGHKLGTGANKRSVWTVATQPYPEAHFATFPPKLIEPMVLAGAPRRACGVCGAPWVATGGERVLDLSRPQARRASELAEQHGITPEHIAALRACGVGDAGKAQVTQSGFGRNRDDVQALADEAKQALGGYTREFLLARPTRGESVASCDHGDGSGTGVVLDPFAGSGTTLQVAVAHGRSAIGIELNEDYAELARRRLAGVTPSMFDLEPAA